MERRKNAITYAFKKMEKQQLYDQQWQGGEEKG
jgi:hypothetical protein